MFYGGNPAPAPLAPAFDPTSMNKFFARLEAEGKLPPPRPPIDQADYFRRLDEHGRASMFRRLGRWVKWKLTGFDYCPVCDCETHWRREVLYDEARVYDDPEYPGDYFLEPYPYGSACICTGCDVAVMHIPEVGLTVLHSSEIAR